MLLLLFAADSCGGYMLVGRGGRRCVGDNEGSVEMEGPPPLPSAVSSPSPLPLLGERCIFRRLWLSRMLWLPENPYERGVRSPFPNVWSELKDGEWPGAASAAVEPDGDRREKSPR